MPNALYQALAKRAIDQYRNMNEIVLDALALELSPHAVPWHERVFTKQLSATISAYAQAADRTVLDQIILDLEEIYGIERKQS